MAAAVKHGALTGASLKPFADMLARLSRKKTELDLSGVRFLHEAHHLWSLGEVALAPTGLLRQQGVQPGPEQAMARFHLSCDWRPGKAYHRLH